MAQCQTLKLSIYGVFMGTSIAKSDGIRELKTYDESPFIDHVDSSKRRKTEILYDGKQAVFHRETGEVLEDQLSVARIKYVEENKFVKVYTANVSVFFDLSKAAQRVCEFLIDRVSINSINTDKVSLYYLDYKEFCNGRGGSQNTFNRGQRELAAKALIAKSNRRDQWFINPAILFNGDRARFITEVRKKRKSRTEIAEENGQMRLIEDIK